MAKIITNKRKILNDPIYGFITIPNDLAFDIIEHPYFQRLRRISQLGLSYLVYPGAYHTRFHHAIGAMHLATKAIKVLQGKGHKITKEESDAVIYSILLHDIGHAPFSHALENTLIKDYGHEKISLMFMQKLNKEFNGKLNLAIKIFTNRYHKKFLHQLISSQLDVDRLDYLKRDSFYTGVTEGEANSNRIIKLLNVHNDQLVVDAKGIYSIEKFIVARRLMYWQVYLHKTVLVAENMLIKILNRAIKLTQKGVDLPCSNALKKMLHVQKSTFLDDYSKLDDFDVFCAIKEWCNSDDYILKNLSKKLVNRNLLKIELSNKKISNTKKNRIKKSIKKKLKLSDKEANYLVFTGKVVNNAYNKDDNKISLLFKNGKIQELSKATDQMNILALSKKVTKHFICFPK